MRSITVVIPVHNEEQNISAMYEALGEIFDQLKERYSHEIIFVNDGSNDGTGVRIEELSAMDPNIKYIEFSRNFGKEVALSAGIHHSCGDAVILMDADLQHPPSLIPKFIESWEGGVEVVIGVRDTNRGESLFRRISSDLFYIIMNSIGEINITSRATDFRLLDRKVVDEFNRLTEHNRMTRGLIAWLGFKRDFVHFQADARKFGRPQYSLIKLIRLAFSSFTSFSLFPLKMAGYIGAVITFIAALLGIFILLNIYVIADPFKFHFSGPAMLAIFNMFLIGIVLICLGLIALYIANISYDVSNRPLYVIREKKNLDSK